MAETPARGRCCQVTRASPQARRSGRLAPSGLGGSLEEFRASLLKIRRAGFYLSKGELEAGMSAVAVNNHGN